MKTDTNTKNMTTGDPKRIIIQFAVPIFLSQLFQQLYNSVDSIIVGNYLGKEALAAVSSSGTLIFLLVSFFTGTAMGAGVLISRYYGAKEYDKMSDVIHTNVALGLISGILLSIFGVIMTPYILRWMGTAKEVLPQSITYFRYYFMGVIAVVMYNICTGIMNAVGDSRRPLYYLIFSSLLNVVLDLLFVGVLGMGVGSAACATIISQVASVVLCLNHLLKKGTIYQIQVKKIKIHKERLTEILKYGLPTGVQNSVIALANVLVQSNINSFGADAMAGCGAYSKIEGFAFLPITCFAMALTTFIGQNLGAKQYDRAKMGARFGILASIILAEVIGVIIFFGAPALVRMFNDSPSVVAIGVRQARTEALFYFLLSFSHCIAGVCRGAGKAIVPMLIMLLIWCVFRIIYITVAMQIHHDIQLLFIAYPMTWSMSSIIYLIYYKKSNWIHGFD